MASEQSASRRKGPPREEQLVAANAFLNQDTSQITATIMHHLMTENLQLEKDLKAADDILSGIRSSLRPCSTLISTVLEISVCHESLDTGITDSINVNEGCRSLSGPSTVSYAMGDSESDEWSTILKPTTGLGLDEIWDRRGTDLYTPVNLVGHQGER